MIELVGLGPGGLDDLTRRAETALRSASDAHAAGVGRLLFRTAHHPAAHELRTTGLQFESFDYLYESASDFAALYRQIAETVINVADVDKLDVTYVVPGSVTTGEETTRLILMLAAEREIQVTIIPSPDFVSPVLAAVKVAASSGYDVRDALSLQHGDVVDAQGFPASSRLSTERPLIVFQVYDRDIASFVKLALMRDYPDDWRVALVQAAGTPNENIRWVPLHKLDRENPDHLTSLFVPALSPELRPRDFAALTGIMARLRAPDGCPWDREQTHQTLKRYFVEETYEVLDAIDAEDPEGLCEELGDALLQSVFHAQLASEEGVFCIDDVVGGIVTKLIRRHPHVFGDVDAADSDAVLVNWEKIKRGEKKAKPVETRISALDGVPTSMPSLVRAMEISRKAVKVGFDWADMDAVMDKVTEELDELRDELSREVVDTGTAGREIADLVFTLVQVARHLKLDAEELLREMLRRFETRFRAMEELSAASSRALRDCSPEELDALWQRAKAVERGGLS